MNPEEFKILMKQIHDDFSGDPEAFHAVADDLMCGVLTKLGYHEGVEIFQNTDKWYS